MNNINRYYEILGLKPGASLSEVKQAYRKQAKTWHPDLFFDDPQQKQKAESEIKKINEAYEYLKSYQPISPNKTSLEDTYSTYSLAAEIYYNLGVKNIKNKKYEKAIDNFTQAIRIEPNHIEAYRYRGFAYCILGENSRAKLDYEKASSLGQKHTETEPTPASPPPKPPKPPPSPPPTSPWECVQTLNGHSDAVSAVAISRDRRTLVSASFDKTIKLWHLGTGQLIRTLGEHSDRVRCIAVSRDGMTLASGSADKTIALWYLGTGKLIRTLGGMFSGHSDEVTAVAFSRDGQTLVSGSVDKTIKLWQVSTGKEICTLTGQSAQVLSVAISPGGGAIAGARTGTHSASLLACGGLEKPLRIRQMGNGKLIRSIAGNSSYVWSLAFSPDGHILASGGLAEIKLWRLGTGEEICTIGGHSDIVYSVAFSPDGKTLASGSADKTIKLWQLDAGKEICTLAGHLGGVNSVAFSPDGQTIVSASSDKTIKIWRRN